MKKDADEARVLQVFDECGDRRGRQEIARVDERPGHGAPAHLETRHVPPAVELRQKTGYTRKVAAIAVAVLDEQETLLLEHLRDMCRPRKPAGQPRDRGGAELSAGADGADGGEEVERIAAERIGAGRHQRAGLAPADVERAPGPPADAETDQPEADPLNRFASLMGPVRRAEHECEADEGDREQQAGPADRLHRTDVDGWRGKRGESHATPGCPAPAAGSS